MPESLPSTFFTESPSWGWIIVFYFLLGGLAGGAAFIGGLLEMIGRPADRPLVRFAAYIAFPAVILGTILLIVDLTRPERFWHMIIQSETGWPMFKAWSPISFGAWTIGVFGAVTFLQFLRALVDDGYIRWRGLAEGFSRLPWVLIAIVSALLGLFVAGYTGVLLTVTNRPIWANTSLLGALFLLSGVSTAAAALVLFGWATRNVPLRSLHRLERLDTGMMLLELIALIALVLSLGAVARLWLSWWGVLLAVGVVLLGILVPILLHAWPRLLGPRLASVTAAVLVLVGGLVLRIVMVLSSEAVPYGGYAAFGG